LRTASGTRVVLVDNGVVRLDGDGACPAWVDANAGRLGFYRVAYAAPLARALAAQAPSLEPAERVGLLSDAWFDVLRGAAPIGDYLALVTRLRGERAPAVLAELGARLEFVGRELVPVGERSAFARFVGELLAPAYSALGWSARDGDDDGVLLARAAVIDLLGRVARAPDILAAAARALAGCLGAGSKVDGAVGDVIVELAAERGDARLFHDFLGRLRGAHSPAERARFLDALPQFPAPRLMHRALSLALTDAVPADVLPRFAVEIAASGEQRRAAEWSFLKSHFETLDARVPRVGWLVGAAQQFCDAAAARDVARFLEPRLRPATVRATVEHIVACAAVRRHDSDAVAGWLRTRYAEARATASAPRRK
jgi:aminopeptidase N